MAEISVVKNEELLKALNGAPAVKSDFNMILIGLRRRQLSGSYQCAKATLEIIRALLGRCNFSSTEQMMNIVRAAGKELTNAAPSEFSIGNLIRRVLFFIREEHATQNRQMNSALAASGDATIAPRPVGRGLRSGSMGSHSSTGSMTTKETTTATIVSSVVGVGVASAGTGSEEKTTVRVEAIDKTLANLTIKSHATHHSLESILGGSGTYDDDDHYAQFLPGLKAGVLGAINELNTEIDDTTTICQRAPDFVHAGECILTFGYSRIVELFLRAAGAKRRFQLIVAEGSPGLDGHKFAQSLSKVPTISVTLIPDSNIYALMARVNEVIVSPRAIMADGGAICNSGNLMVAVAAKDFSVPVVCIAEAFTVTPHFVHTQGAVLDQLLSPADALPYNAAHINLSNVEVNYPAFDYLPPDLVTLYVTNDGTQLPSYIFRQLSEYYHPRDYNIVI